jgi:predicted DNA-binding WGR domain protein
MRIYLQTPPGPDTPPRFYHLILQQDLLEGWDVVRESGNQGGSGRVRRDHFEDRDSALQALIKLRDAQIKRGYQVVFVQGLGGPSE